jgi:hypothetical protein
MKSNEKCDRKQYGFNLRNFFSALGKGKKVLLIALGLFISSTTIGFAVRAFNRDSSETALPESVVNLPAAAAMTQASLQPKARYKTYLARNVEIDAFRRLLGSRFLVSGKDASILTGTLTANGQSFNVRIERLQTDQDEQVAIAFNGGQNSLGWSGKDGARLNGGSLNSSQQKMIERIALDSPDQFILAQLRNATYKTIAHHVVPAGAGSLEDYVGPSWTAIHVGEVGEQGERKTLSPYRVYYFNSTTGLLDKVASQEGDDYVMADFSNWTEQGGEKIPTKIVWSMNKQVVMELTLNSATHAP